MRLFIAVLVPEELKERIAETQEKIRRAGVDAKLVEPENLHFTFKFLGETGEEKIQEIKKAIEKGCASFKPFEISVAGLDAFPSRNYAKAVWIGVRNGYEQIRSLMEAINEKLSQIGFTAEKEHTPHLTLARVRSSRNMAELLRLFENLEEVEIGRMHVNEVKLMKSTLNRSGPVYEEVYSVKLK